MCPLLKKKSWEGQSCLCKAFLPFLHLRPRSASVYDTLVFSAASFPHSVRSLHFSLQGDSQRAPELLRIWKHFLWEAFSTVFFPRSFTGSFHFRRLLHTLCGHAETDTDADRAETRMQMLGAHIPLHSRSLWFACLPLRGLFPQGRQKDSCASCTSLTALVKRFKKWMIRNFWKSLHLCPWILTYYLNILSESSRSRSNMCSLKSTVSSGSWHSQFCKTSQDGKQYPSLMT